MIVVNLIGGLGNQMFQYAVGLALAKTKSQSLHLDIDDFAGYRLHNGFELPRVFSGEFDVAESAHLQKVIGWRASRPVRTLLRRPYFSWLRGKHYVVEPHFHYWKEWLTVPENCYLYGYWQSERYFSSVEDSLRRNFEFRRPLEEQNAVIAERIAKCNAISLHIRRGDYVAHAKTSATHGALPIAYYQRAVKFIAERVRMPRFFVFSDDISWAKVNLGLDQDCEYVGHNSGFDSYRDMQLMSMCNHHIIANSSFSWWGAWLNPDPEKMVLYPEHWFRRKQVITDDLFPPGWQKISYEAVLEKPAAVSNLS